MSAARLMLLLEQPAAESAREEALASAKSKSRRARSALREERVGAKSESRAAPMNATLELRAAETLDECEHALPIGSERGESEHALGAQQANAQQLQPACREHSTAQAEQLQLQPALTST